MEDDDAYRKSHSFSKNMIFDSKGSTEYMHARKMALKLRLSILTEYETQVNHINSSWNMENAQIF